ncbi:DUF2202 domain-containing protein [Falsiroseomonas sp.]|uniref:DUF2202 domain-containing protein n=1 Tax=Falsiroseomonas sp. TaxID=2870721 RepID=UPI00356B5A13
MAKSEHARGATQPAGGTSEDLSAEEIATLLFAIEEEKLAGDVYEAFADLYDARIFDQIAGSEDRHLDALLRQADRLGVDTSELPTGTGEFLDAELQELYETLLAKGSLSYEDALEVGIHIENEDLLTLQAAQDETDDPGLDRAYASLEDGSENHLAAFTAAYELLG